MNPHLTTRGRWLFVTAIAFLLVGAVIQQPVLLLLGQVPIVLLVVSYMLCLPAALALDRRRVTLSVEQEGQPEGGRSSHVVGDVIEAHLVSENFSRGNVHGLRLAPFASQALEVRGLDTPLSLIAGTRALVPVEFVPGRSGRWMLHGFDAMITDPLGLVQSKDYLPCVHAFECYPRAGRLARAPRTRDMATMNEEPGRQRRPRAVSSGLDIRQLRDYQPGDPLRQIAWKASARTGTLVSREYDQEVTLSTYIMLDISSSMRAGSMDNQKLEHAIHLCTELASAHLAMRNRVGLMTFDEKLYAHLAPVQTSAKLGRLVHHLLGLNAIVDPDLTEFDDAEAQRLLVDYLLVQERLDFRKGKGVDPATGINEGLLERWLQSVLPAEERELGSQALTEGILAGQISATRRFLQLRGVDLPYRVEARLGMKERGLLDAIEHLVKTTRQKHQIVVVSDLCAVMNMELLSRGIRLAQAQGHRLAFAVPFTPRYGESSEDFSPRYKVMRELFTVAEREERERIVARVRAMGVGVELIGPRDKLLFANRR